MGYRRDSRASSSRSEGKGHDKPAALARLIVASTVLLQTPQALAASRLLLPHSQTSRNISRILRMVTRPLGILPSFIGIEDDKIHRQSYLATIPQFALAVFVGMLAVFKSEPWPFCSGIRIFDEERYLRENLPGNQKMKRTDNRLEQTDNAGCGIL
jgi:hypothetical protein